MSGLNGYTTVYPHGIWIFVLSQPTINTRDLLGNIVLLLLHYGSIFRKGRDSLICNRVYIDTHTHTHTHTASSHVQPCLLQVLLPCVYKLDLLELISAFF